MQLRHQIDEYIESGELPIAVVFGGDWNMTPAAPAYKEFEADTAWRVASGNTRSPTAFPIVTGSRLDHIFVRGNLQALSTEIPELTTCHPCCGLGPCGCSCGMHWTQKVMDDLGLSKPSVPGCWRRCVGLCYGPCFMLGTGCCFAAQFPSSYLRCKEALQEWGSDHLPVTVTFRLGADDSDQSS